MSKYRSTASKRKIRRLGYLAGILASAFPAVAEAATVANPLCPRESVSFNPGNGEDIVLPKVFRVSVFASGLNFATGIAFLSKGGSKEFEVFVLESGHGLPSRCNEQDSFGSGMFDPANPFTPDILVFNQAGTKIRGPLGKPSAVGGFQPAGPAVDIAFETGFRGGRLFAPASKPTTHPAGQKKSPRNPTREPLAPHGPPLLTAAPPREHPPQKLAL